MLFLHKQLFDRIIFCRIYCANSLLLPEKVLLSVLSKLKLYGLSASLSPVFPTDVFLLPIKSMITAKKEPINRFLYQLLFHPISTSDDFFLFIPGQLLPLLKWEFSFFTVSFMVR